MSIHKWVDCDIGCSDDCDIVNIMACGEVLGEYQDNSTVDDTKVTCKKCLKVAREANQ